MQVRQKNWIHAAITLVLCIGLGAPAAAAAPRDRAEREVLAAIRGRLDAVGRNDVAAWARYVDEDLLAPLESTTGSKQAWIRAHGPAWPAAVKYYYGPLEDVKVRLHGNTAVVAFRARQYNETGGQVTYTDTWQVETHVRRGGAWRLVLLADSPMAPEPTAIRIDPSSYDALAGEYQWAPGMVSVVVRDGDRLVEHYPGQGPYELLPESESTFFVRGEAADGGTSRIRFVRDEYGVVTHYVYSTYGSTEFRAPRIRP